MTPDIAWPAGVSPQASLPRSPVLDWSSFRSAATSATGGIEQAPNKALTTSGRASIYHALLQLGLPPGSAVLVPTYHCPTMIAPVVCAGHEPVFFGIGPTGLPNLETIPPALAQRAKAIIVAHYFGVPHSLQPVRDWCDRHGIVLVEDCAHCYFGVAGDRPVGHWGDYATASLSKFFPVPEAGLLASTRRPIEPLALRPRTFRAEVKGWVDVLEFAVGHHALSGLNAPLKLLFDWKNRSRPPQAAGLPPERPSQAALLASCDMARIADAPLGVSRLLDRWLPRERIAARRRENYAVYARHLRGAAGARPVFDEPEQPAEAHAFAPYVFAIRVDDADRVYHALRRSGYPVFRWDVVWAGTPSLAGDVGPDWSRHVLQLLCHQDLSADDVAVTARAVLALVQPGGASAARKDSDR